MVTSPVNAEAAEAVEPAGLPREHTLASLALMLLFSLVALYGFDWATADQYVEVRRWDLGGDEASGGAWRFPERNFQRNSQGWSYSLDQPEPGPRLAERIDAASVALVRVHATLIRLSTGEEAPLQLELYWAGPEDAGEGKWPFDTARGVTFYTLDRHRPNEYTALLYTHEQWSGTVEELMIGVKVPAQEGEAFRLNISTIELLK